MKLDGRVQIYGMRSHRTLRALRLLFPNCVQYYGNTFGLSVVTWVYFLYIVENIIEIEFCIDLVQFLISISFLRIFPIILVLGVAYFRDQMGFNFREEIYFLFRCRIKFLNIFRENDSRRKLNSLFYFFRLRRTVKFSFSWKTCMRDLKFHNRIVIALFYMFSLYRVSIIYVSKVARMENKFLRYIRLPRLYQYAVLHIADLDFLNISRLIA